MLKFVVANPTLYFRLSRIPVLKDLFTFDIRQIPKITSEEAFTNVLDTIRMSNGTFKTTLVNRLRSVDESLIPWLDGPKQYKIHDMAVSDGVTSRDLYNRLASAGIKFQLTISDKYSVIRYTDGIAAHFYDADGGYLFTNIIGIHANRFLSRKYFLSRLFGTLFYTSKRRMEPGDKSITLINPSVTDLIRKGEVNFVDHDIFNESNSKFDIIRAMNILNPKYFSEHQLNLLLQNIDKSLADGGLLVVGRTEPGTTTNNATIYRKQLTEFHKIGTVGKGNEIDELISSYVSVGC